MTLSIGVFSRPFFRCKLAVKLPGSEKLLDNHPWFVSSIRVLASNAPPSSLTWLAGNSTMNKSMYFLLQMVIFQCHVSFAGEYFSCSALPPRNMLPNMLIAFFQRFRWAQECQQVWRSRYGSNLVRTNMSGDVFPVAGWVKTKPWLFAVYSGWLNSTPLCEDSHSPL